MIGVKGQKNPQNKGRKGFLAYVTKTGKVWILKGRKKDPYKARKMRELEPEGSNRALRKAAKKFDEAKLVLTKRGKPVVRGRGKVLPGAGFEFSDNVVSTIAKDLKNAIEAQQSRRSFNVRINTLVELPDGTKRVYETSVPIDKQDRQAVEIGGVKNFVRQKVYCFLARQLQFDGFVSQGSANHVRRLSANKNKERGEWIQRDGSKWRGNESAVVKISAMEYKIEQAQ